MYFGTFAYLLRQSKESLRIAGQWQGKKRSLERELARTKVSANRVVSVVANEWKDASER